MCVNITLYVNPGPWQHVNWKQNQKPKKIHAKTHKFCSEIVSSNIMETTRKPGIVINAQINATYE